ncbi:MAG: hypothetical protein RMI91_13495, partial [Gemmatales bacterium]|nr:hypothetical protein [Gemmatales bacterium]
FLRVKSLAHKPEAVISFLPDEYQVRFIPPAKADGHYYIRFDPELHVSSPEVYEEKYIWNVRYNDKQTKICWDVTNRMLYVEVENNQNFRVSFAASEEIPRA